LRGGGDVGMLIPLQKEFQGGRNCLKSLSSQTLMTMPYRLSE
jgi:hypothetical protein